MEEKKRNKILEKLAVVMDEARDFAMGMVFMSATVLYGPILESMGMEYTSLLMLPQYAMGYLMIYYVVKFANGLGDVVKSEL